MRLLLGALSTIVRNHPMARRAAFLGSAGRRAALFVCLMGAALAGCGHPASAEECEEIFNRSAEIELRMQNVNDPKLIQERTAAVRKDRGEDLVKQCVGKRITNEAMACVRAAKTSQDMDRCLD